MAVLWGLLLRLLETDHFPVLQIHSSLHNALHQVLKGIQSGEGVDVVLTVFGDQVGVTFHVAAHQHPQAC
jgi:phosphatidylserine decarboxylase